MEQEYTISTGWKIFMISVAVFLLGFSFYIFSLGEGVNNSSIIFLIPISILAISVWIILAQIRGKIIISERSIIRVNAFSTKEIALNDIRGCRVGEKRIVILSNSANSSNILINNYDVYRNSDDIKKYLNEHFKDIDATELENEKDQLLHNPTLGFTEQERKEKLGKIKWITLSYNLFGTIIGFGSILIDNKTGTIILLLYPLVGIIVMATSKGLIKFLSNSKRSVYGFIMLGFLLPSFILLIKSLFNYDLSEYNNLWFPSLVISVILVLLLYIIGINRSVASITGQAIIMIIASSLYGFGSIRQVNCEFDESTPKVIHATIDSKCIEYNKGTHHHLKIVSWDSNPKPKDVEVSESKYDQYSTGNTIDVKFKKGLFNIPWYYIK